MTSEELARRIGLAWESLPEPRHAFSLEIISQDRPSMYVNLGPHPPRLWPEDVDRLHDLWLRLSDTEAVGLGCTIATLSAWRCAGWKKIWRTANGTM